MTTVACLHHLDEPFLGTAEAPLRAAGLTLDERSLGHGDALPRLEDLDGILTLGGAQSAVDLEADPALGAEAALLRDAVTAGVPVLGVCLGAQVLARAFGATVRRAPRRMVAWAQLDALAAAAGDAVFGALPEPVPALHWNEDLIELPPGATELLGRAGEGVAAFRVGTCGWGVQFHPDVDAAALERWYAAYGAWLAEAGVAEDAARAADARHLPAQAELAERLFGAFAAVVRTRAAASAS